MYIMENFFQKKFSFFYLLNKSKKVDEMNKILETDRLSLRELTLEDTAKLSKVLSDPESMQYYPAPFNKDKVE